MLPSNKRIEKNNSGSDLKEKALATLSVFSRNDTIFGLPTKVIALGVGNTTTIGFFLYWPAGIAFGALFFYGMYQIHQKDPKAFDIWCHVIRRLFNNTSSRWCAGKGKSTRLVFISHGV